MSCACAEVVADREGELVAIGCQALRVSTTESPAFAMSPRSGRTTPLSRSSFAVSAAVCTAARLARSQPISRTVSARRPGLSRHPRERVPWPADEQQAGPLPFWPVRHGHGRRASEASGGSGDQDGS